MLLIFFVLFWNSGLCVKLLYCTRRESEAARVKINKCVRNGTATLSGPIRLHLLDVSRECVLSGLQNNNLPAVIFIAW